MQLLGPRQRCEKQYSLCIHEITMSLNYMHGDVYNVPSTLNENISATKRLRHRSTNFNTMIWSSLLGSCQISAHIEPRQPIHFLPSRSRARWAARRRRSSTVLDTSHEGERRIVVVTATMLAASDERLMRLTLSASARNETLLLYSQLRRAKLSI